jgi:lipase chaperone LimK
MSVKNISIRNVSTLLIIATMSAVIVSVINFNIKKSPDINESHTSSSTLASLEPASSSAEHNTTQHLLGYESRYGILPNSLRGTTLDNALQVDESGHLIISNNIKDLFDYFLSTISEEELATILLRIDEYLSHYLQEPALSESKTVLAQYVEFKYALLTLEQEMSKNLTQMSQKDKINGGYLSFLRKQIDQRNALRELHLDLAVYEAFYEEEQRYDEYTYSKLLVNSNKSLSARERLDKVTEFQNTLPEDVRQSMRETQITDELKIRTEKILADGGDQEQVRGLRREMFGDDAVQRFDELDQERAQWNVRTSEYLAQRANILNTQGLAIDKLNLQVDALRASLFDKLEQIRVRSLERNTKV